MFCMPCNLFHSLELFNAGGVSVQECCWRIGGIFLIFLSFVKQKVACVKSEQPGEVAQKVLHVAYDKVESDATKIRRK